MRIVERDRRSVKERVTDEWRRDGGEALDRMLSISFDGYQRAWERGFAKAMDIMAQQNEKVHLAKGTRDLGNEDTAPYPIIDPETL